MMTKKKGVLQSEDFKKDNIIGYGNAFLLENLLNDVIAGQNDPIYKLLPSSVI